MTRYSLLFLNLLILVLGTGIGLTIASRLSRQKLNKAKEAMRQRDHYRAVVDDQTDLICRFLGDGTLTFVNASYCRYFNRVEADLIGTNFLNLASATERPGLSRLLQKLQTLTPQNPILIQEESTITSDGQLVWQHWTNLAIFNSKGDLVEFQAVGRDMSDRKHAETKLQTTYTKLEDDKNQLEFTNAELQQTVEALLTSQEQLKTQNTQLLIATQSANAERTRYQDLFDFAPDGSVVTDANGCIQAANRALAGLLQCEQDRLIGQPFADYVIDRDRLQVQNLLGQFQLHTHSTPQELEISLYSSTVAPLPVLVTVAPIYRQEDLFQGARWAIHNITNRKQIEANLAASEARFQEIAHTISQVFFVRSATTGQFIYVSPAYEQIWGRSCQSLYENPQSWLEAIHPDDRSQVVQSVKQQFAGHSVQREYRIIRPAGEIRWIFAQLTLVQDETGEPLRFIGIGFDITDIKQAEDALYQSEERLRFALNAARMGTWHWDVETNQIRWSESMEQLMGLQPGTFDGRFETVVSMIYPDDLSLVLEAINRSIEQGAEYDIEFRFVKPDGNIRWAASKGNILRDQSGRAIQMAGIDVDITDRKQTEAALRNSQALLATAQRLIKLGSWEFQLQTNKIVWSEELFHMFGLDPNQPEPTYTQYLQQCIHPDDRLKLEQCVEHAMINGIGYTIDYRAILPDGSTRYHEGRGEAECDAQGRVIRLYGTALDITDRKQALFELQQAKDAAEAANLAKSTFLANMSHELRTPLNIILGYTQLLSYDPFLNPEYQEYLHAIHRSGNHLLSLINDVLDLSKIEAGRLTLDPSSFDLFDLMQTLKELFRLRAESKQLELVLELGDVPQFIAADLNKLRQVMMNLLSNAVKFTDSGTITLRALRNVKGADREQHDMLASRQSGTHSAHSSSILRPFIVTFEVEDTGIGIAPNEMDLIFEAFSQADAGKQAVEGTGLGLTISQKFVQLMGGQLSVTSTIGQGSRFSFWIPVQPVDPEKMKPRMQNRPVVGLLPGQPQYRVLIVDDQLDNRLLLARLLKKLGLVVQEATSGPEAIQIWQTWHPDLIWMDIRMAGMTGYEAMQQIRALEQQPYLDRPVPIIAITAQAYQEDRERALAAGFTDFVTKPFEVAIVFQQLAQYLGLQYQYAELTGLDAIEIASNVPHDHEPEPLTSSLLQSMPTDWIRALHKAALNCSSQEVEDLIAKIPNQQDALAQGLKRLVHSFEFEVIMRLTEPN